MKYLIVEGTDKLAKQLVRLHPNGFVEHLATHLEGENWVGIPDDLKHLGVSKDLRGEDTEEITEEEAAMILFQSDPTLIDRVAAMISK